MCIFHKIALKTIGKATCLKTCYFYVLLSTCHFGKKCQKRSTSYFVFRLKKLFDFTFYMNVYKILKFEIKPYSDKPLNFTLKNTWKLIFTSLYITSYYLKNTEIVKVFDLKICKTVLFLWKILPWFRLQTPLTHLRSNLNNEFSRAEGGNQRQL